jgi:hypothetical protein
MIHITLEQKINITRERIARAQQHLNYLNTLSPSQLSNLPFTTPNIEQTQITLNHERTILALLLIQSPF